MLTQLKHKLEMKTLKVFLPTISGWLTRKGLELAGYAGLTITAYYKAKESAIIEGMIAAGAPPDQVADFILHASNWVTSTVALIPSVAAIVVSLILSRISAKLAEK